MTSEPHKAWTAADIRDALRKRWPVGEHIHLTEVPLTAMGDGRKIDVAVIGLWPSRGHEIDAIEIKVSIADARRELANPSKADGWWRHSDRFWLACPDDVAKRIRGDMPTTWGLLAVSERGTRVASPAPRREQREPLSWSQIIGLLRGAGAASSRAIEVATADGYQRGLERGRAQAMATQPAETPTAELDRLRAQVAAFESASGISISDRYGGEFHARQIGQLVALARRTRLANDIDHIASALRRGVDLADKFETLIRPPVDEERPGMTDANARPAWKPASQTIDMMPTGVDANRIIRMKTTSTMAD